MGLLELGYKKLQQNQVARPDNFGYGQWTSYNMISRLENAGLLQVTISYVLFLTLLACQVCLFPVPPFRLLLVPPLR